MATTFIDEIRDLQAYRLETATPTSLAGTAFARHAGEADFSDWANANPQAAFRRFELTDLFEYEPVASSNLDRELVSAVVQLAVAYPIDYRYGEENARDRSDVIREDLYTAIARCGELASGTTWPAFAAIAERRGVVTDDAVEFLQIDMRVTFWHDVTSHYREYLTDAGSMVTIDGAPVYDVG